MEQKEITRTTTGPVASTDDYKMVNEKCLAARHYPVNWARPPGAPVFHWSPLAWCEVRGSHHKTLIYRLLQWCTCNNVTNFLLNPVLSSVSVVLPKTIDIVPTTKLDQYFNLSFVCSRLAV